MKPPRSLEDVNIRGLVLGHMWPKSGPVQSPAKTVIFYIHSLEGVHIAFLPKPFVMLP